jgi:hypothetical protein
MTPIQRINTRIKHGVTAQTLRSEGVLEPYIKNALRLAGVSPTNEWTYPSGFKGPPPAPAGHKLVVEYYDFMGIEKRWKYVVEPHLTYQEED